MVAAAAVPKNGPYNKFVNAVLRRLTREGAVLANDPGRQNTPDWLWNSWVRAYGAAQAAAIAEAHLVEPPLDITVKFDPDRWAQQLDAKCLPTGSLRRTRGGDIRSLPGFVEGAWWVQDAAAALPLNACGKRLAACNASTAV